MKKVKIATLFFVFFLAGSNTVFAQKKITEQTTEFKEVIQEYEKALDLTEEQKPKFKTITLKYARQMKSIKEEGGGKLKMYSKFKAIKNDKDAEMKALLSKEQYDIYLKKQEEIHKKMKDKR